MSRVGQFTRFGADIRNFGDRTAVLRIAWIDR